MKLGLLILSLVVVAEPAWSAPLGNKSKAPDWAKATQAEKDAWIAAYQFKQADVKKPEVSACMDQYAIKPIFETNDLSGVTQMCETISALPN